ncbi:ankyrin repeat-containing domain protein [Mycena maculata]|uniref:Ankyrin repeat-containing domain protein n=1 Tax=Mycena maculata TaxID=230809 RepID=A0AAD7JQ19_9AGAR|nr:ankyrin repeat-containing domain protein [Mycena maculata]
MPDHTDWKKLTIKWIHRKGSMPTDPSTPVPERSTSAAESVIYNSTLALSLAEQALDIAQVAPFIGPAAALLGEVLKSYREFKSANEKQDLLVTHITDITGDICAGVLRLEVANHSDLIQRLKTDLENYAGLIGRASRFIQEYDDQGNVRRYAGRNQLGEEIDKLIQELNLFGARFRSINTRALEDIHNIVVLDRLEKWLHSPPDMAQKLYDTEKLRMQGTGLWFLEGEQFIEWQDNPGVLWIKGPSGAGKSVLRDKNTQSVEIALQRIVLQLSAQCQNPYRKLPSYKDLEKILQQILEELGRTYIILDALDECNDSELNQLVNLVSTLRAWTNIPLHLLITSQPRPIFIKSFRGVNCIPLEYDITQEDVKFFINNELKTNSALEIWQPSAVKVTDLITRKSNGMFRLATCLLIELSCCPWAEEDELNHTLDTLPEDLCGIYDRFLQGIRSEHLIYVEVALRWLLFSATSLSPVELAEAIAFDFSNPEQYTYKPSRLEGNRVLLPKWLAGLVAINFDSSGNQVISLAHESVQDYLLSNHFTNKFGADLREDLSHTFISQTCINYLLYFAAHPLGEEVLAKYPLAKYAATHWCSHLLHCHDQTILFDAAMQLLEDGSEQYSAFSCFLNHTRPWEKIESPLHFCCQEAYIEGVEALLTTDADVNLANINSPLVLACQTGCIKIVHLLLKNGADVNLPSKKYVSALNVASYRGYLEIVHLLLEKGANINLTGGGYGSALSGASFWGYIDIVHLLLEKGADINLPGGYYGSPLGAASYGGQLKIVHLLLEMGADINLPGGDYGSPLGAASSWGTIEIVNLLLESGADLNLPGGDYGSALGAASYQGHLEIVHILLEKGADINIPDRDYGSALGVASQRGHIEIVHLLLESGAEINLQSEYYGSALGAASYGGHLEIVCLLLEKGANINLPGGNYGSALGAASYQGHLEIIHLLLEKGADVNLPGKLMNVLGGASYFGNINIVQLLLNSGANINLLGGDYGCALEIAASQGHIKLVHLLLNHGADINLYGRIFGGPLSAATLEGHIEIVQLLLNSGANINLLDMDGDSPLMAASGGQSLNILQLLLESGANINYQGGHFGSALGEASYCGHIKNVQLLIDFRADLKTQGGHALKLAKKEGHADIVALLQEKGVMDSELEESQEDIQASTSEGVTTD